MFYRAATISVLLVFLTSLITASTVTKNNVDSFSLTQDDYSYSSLKVGLRNLVETFARNIGRRLFADYKPYSSMNILKYSSSESLLSPGIDKEGFWIGAPSVIEISDNSSYIFYRLRDPFRRGWKVVIAKKEGEKLENIWEMNKYDHRNVKSLEGAALQKKNGSYSLFLSYQEENTGRWSINHLTADDPSEFNFSNSQKLDLEFEDYTHFKDPIIHKGRLVVHVASKNFLKTTNVVAELPFNGTVREIHIGSEDYSGNRITSLISVNQTDLVFFDHKKNIVFTGEEKGRVGILSSSNHVETLDGFSLESNHSTNSLRYVRALKDGERVKLYYEAALPGKGHELRKTEMNLNLLLRKLGMKN